jgi:ABC-type branched-subunit amino acid transport system substrate-binding protein
MRHEISSRQRATMFHRSLSLYVMRHTSLSIARTIAFVALATNVAAQVPPSLRVGFVATADSRDSVAAAIERGVRLGAEEARRTANLFGGDVLLFAENSAGNPERAASRLLAARNVQVLIGSSATDADALSRFAETHGIVFFNTVSRAASLRTACRRYSFHIEASDPMYENALKRTAASRPVIGMAVLWAPTLERYGASQINDRFRAKYRMGMDGNAWAGWVAVKIAAESALRAGSAQPAAIRSYLESSATTFDAHKGWPLSFRASDHQLRQPLYVVVREAQPGRPSANPREVPELRELSASGATPDAKRLLDALIPESASRCSRNSR